MVNIQKKALLIKKNYVIFEKMQIFMGRLQIHPQHYIILFPMFPLFVQYGFYFPLYQ